ncbi:winged helix-turn-helix domain-containing protein [Streptomyces sp. NPDC093221]|uniref:winged helix-turn-helix domain-containing protein n=1 Tax=Streptomyces sp. NPDC093221 TaxID=3366032 RepID=UPI0037F75B3E
MTIAKDGPQLPSVQVAEALREKLKAGTYAPDEKLPSIKALAADFGVAEETVKKSLATLRAEGLIIPVPNRGHFAVGSNGTGNPNAADRRDLSGSIDVLRSEIQKLTERVAKLEARADSNDA